MNKTFEIRELIKRYSIRESWVAQELGIKTSILHHLLYSSEEIDDELYNDIMELIKFFQIEINFNIQDEDPNFFEEFEIQKGIGERIRVFAKKKYSTLKKLADEMGISPQQLQQYISGKREPGSKILLRLFKLGCDINWLLTGNETIESYKIIRLENEVKKLHNVLNQIHLISKKV